MTYSSEVLADSPLVYWRLGDASGTTATDSSGNSRNGTYTNTPTLGVAGALAGDSDTAVTFNGTDEYVTIANASWMNSLSAVTLECWYKGSDTAGSLVGRSGNPANYRLGITSSHAFMETNTSSGGSQLTAGTTNIADGNWHHIVGVWTGSTMLVYVDGAQENTLAKSGTLSTTSNSLRVAQRDNDSFIAGTIDEAAAYSSALSATRVTAHYTAGTAPSASGTASLSLSASGGAAAPGAGSATLSLSASGGAAAPAAGSASLELSAAGSTEAPEPAAGSASLDLSASGGAWAVAAGSGSLTLSASGSALLSAGGTGSLTFGAVGEAAPLYITDTSNALNGRDRGGSATVTITRPVAAPPATLVLAAKVDKAIAYPTPVMVNGRPT